ncbi:MAG TPA: F0F1 ATP synthase subunit epsilon, partial [Burkholderiales bacterium]|nr:F0F1 ATP synthase subunit epsilon [Burkholderiales bacterium]
SAEETFFSGVAEFIAAPSILGEVGVYPRHAPMLTRLKPGSVRVKRSMSDEEELIYVSGGILEVQPDVVTVLADSAVRGEDLDEAKALEAKQRAVEAMKDKAAAMEFAKAEAELAEAVAQLAAIQKLRKKR